MCGKAYDPRFMFAWPTARYAVMSGDSAADTLAEIKAKQLEREGKKLSAKELERLRESVRATYEEQIRSALRGGAAVGGRDSRSGADARGADLGAGGGGAESGSARVQDRSAANLDVRKADPRQQTVEASERLSSARQFSRHLGASSTMETVKILNARATPGRGCRSIIPTEVKAAYLRMLVEAGFRHIDAVSFVSPKHVRADGRQRSGAGAIPRFPARRRPRRRKLSASWSTTRALSARWRRAASPRWDTRIRSRRISGAPTPICRARNRARWSSSCSKATKDAGRDLVVYISMAFGNPYEEPWGPEIVEETLIWLKDIGVRTVSLADTVGTATPGGRGQAVHGREGLRGGNRAGRAPAQPPGRRRGKSDGGLQCGMPAIRFGAHGTGRLPVCRRRTGRQHRHGNRRAHAGRARHRDRARPCRADARPGAHSRRFATSMRTSEKTR